MRTSFAFAAAVAASVGCTPTRQSLPPPPVEPPATEPPVTTVPAPATPGVQLPLVALHGYDVEDDAEPAISVSPTSLTVDGEEVLALQGGLVARDARDASRDALIPALRDAFESQVARTGPPDRVLLAIDARTPYRTLFDAIYSTRSDEVQRFGLLARAGAHTVVAPIEAPGAAERDPSVPMVSLDKERLVLSVPIEGEDAARESRFEIARDDEAALTYLGEALVELEEQGPPARYIVLAAEPDAPVQLIAALIGTIRATPEGEPLFPDVQLALALDARLNDASKPAGPAEPAPPP